jgi:hypothetical protein
MNYSDKLWDLSNAITAFAVFQAIAFAYRFDTASFRKQVQAAKWLIVAGAIVASALYIGAVFVLTRYQIQLVQLTASPQNDLLRQISWTAFSLKSAAIAVAGGGVCILAYIARPKS